MPSVDEKVISLKFDNAKFEKNIRKSMESLDEFDKKCDEIGGSDIKMNKLQEAFRQTEIAATKAGFQVRDVWLKVASVLEYQVARKIVDLGKKIADAMTLEGIRSGLSEYEMQMNSVQTIMANTGANVQTVNKYLDELNEYADKTIYNFTQMTKNIGLFTAAGVDLEKSTNAIKGIANLAAVSGSDATKASMAMYQLSQALATGTVRLQDWNSVVNAGMGGKVFQEALIRTSEVMGTGAEEAIKKYGSFRDSLTKGAWLTADVLSETLAQIAGAYSEAELLEKGYSKEQVEDILKLAETAESAATDVKTFTQLIDTIKEAVGSGWALTFRTIIGDFEEAKQLYSGISRVLGGIIDRQSDARNAMLQSWKDMGGRRDVINTLINLYNAVNRVVMPIKEAFNDIFGWRSGALQLKEITAGIERFTDKLKLSGRQMYAIRRIFTAIFKTADTLIHILSGVGRGIVNVFKPVIPIGGSVLDVLAAVADIISDINDRIAKSGVVTAVTKGVSAALTIIAKVIAALAISVAKLMAALIKLPVVQNTLKLISAVLIGIAGYVANVVAKILEGKSVLEAINLPAIVDILGKILNVIGLIAGSAIGGAVAGIRKLSDAFSTLFGSGTKVEAISNDFEKYYGDNSAGVVQTIEKGGGKIEEEGERQTNILLDYKEKITQVLTDVGNLIKGFIDSLSFDEIVAKLEGIGRLIRVVTSMYLIYKMSQAIIAIGQAFGELADMMQEQKRALALRNFQTLASSIAMIAGSVAILSQINGTSLLKAIGAVAVIGAGLLALVKILKKIDFTEAGESVKGIAPILLVFTASVLMLSGIMMKLSQIKSTSLLKAFGAIVLTLASLVGTLAVVKVILTRLQASMEGVAPMFLAISASLLIMTGAIAILAEMPEEMFRDGLEKVGTILVTIVAAIAVIAAAMSRTQSMKGVAATILAFGSGLLMVIGALLIFSAIDEYDNFIKGMIKVGVIFAALAGGIVILYAGMALIDKIFQRTSSGLNQLGIAASILAFSKGVSMIAKSLSTLSQADVDGLKQGTWSLGIILAEIGVLMLALQAQSDRANSVNFVKIAFSFGILALAINLLIPPILMMTAINALNPVGAIVATLEIVVLIGTLFALLSKISGDNAATTVKIIAVIGTIVAFGAALYLLSEQLAKMQTDQILASLIGLSLILGAMAIVMAVLKNAKFEVTAIATCIAFAFALLALTVPLVALQYLDWKQIAAGLGGLALVIGALALSLKLIDGVNVASVLLLGALAVELIAFAAAIRLLEGIKWEEVSDGLMALGVALVAIVALGAITGIPVVAAGLEALAIAIGIIGIALAANLVAFSIFIVTFTNFMLVVKEGCTEIVAAFDILITGLTNLIPKVFEATVLLGSALTAGLILGLVEGIKMAVSVLLGGCNDMETAFREYWGIHSPSFKTNWFGQMLVEGLVGGLVSKASDAFLASSNLGSGVLSQLSQYLNYNQGFNLGAIFGNGTIAGIQNTLGQYNIDLSSLLGGGGNLAGSLGNLSQEDLVNMNANLEETAAAEKEIDKAYSDLTDAQLAAMTVQEAQQYKTLAGAKELAEKNKETAKERYKQAQAEYDSKVRNNTATKEDLELLEKKKKWYDNSVKQVEDLDNQMKELTGSEEDATTAAMNLDDAMTNAGGAMSGAGKAASGAASEIESTADSIQSLLDKYDEAWKSKRDDIMKAFDPFSSVEMDTNEVGNLDTMMKNLQAQIDKNAAWGAVSDSLYNRLEAIGASIGNEAGADLAQEWLSGLDVSSTEEVRAINEATDEQLAEFVNMFSTAYGQSGYLATVELNKMREDTEKELAELLNVVSIRLEDVANIFDGTAESIAALQDLAGNDWYQKLINNVPLVSDDIKAALEDGWSIEQLASFGDEAVTNLNNALNEAVDGSLSNITETGSALATGMIEGITQEFSDGGKSLEEAKASMISALADPGSGALLALKDALVIGSPSQLWADEIGWWIFKGIVKGIWDTEGDAAAQIQVIDAAMMAMLDHVKEWVNTFGIVTLHEVGAAMTDYIVDDLGGMQSGVPIQHVRSAMDNISTVATDQLEGHYQDFYDAGVYLIQGLIDGIASMAGALGEAVGGLLGMANSTVTTTEKIHSPSKVWAQFGKYMVGGMIGGIESEATRLEDTVAYVTSKASETAALISAAIDHALNDDDYQPMITPVVDLSEIQNGVVSAEKMWSDMPAVKLSSAVKRNEMEARKAEVESSDNSENDPANRGISFVQNNYSPKALSRLDIYRQTRNQIHQLKGALS